MATYGTIEQIFKSPALLDTDEGDRINVVVKFNDEETVAVYTDEEHQIPAMQTQKGYGVYFGVAQNSQISFKKGSNTTTGYLNFGSMLVTNTQEVNTLYKHVICIATDGRQTIAGSGNRAIDNCLVDILSDDDTPFTKTTFIDYVVEHAVSQPDISATQLVYRTMTSGDWYKGTGTSTETYNATELQALIDVSENARSLDILKIRGSRIDSEGYIADSAVQIANTTSSHEMPDVVLFNDTVFEI